MIEFKVGSFYKFIPTNIKKGFYICKVLEERKDLYIVEVIYDKDESSTRFEVGKILKFSKDRDNIKPRTEYIKEEDVFLEVL